MNHEKSERNLYHFYDFERLYRWPLANDHSPSGIGRATLMLIRDLSEDDCQHIVMALGSWLGAELRDERDPKRRKELIDRSLKIVGKFGFRVGGHDPTSKS